MKNKKGVIIPWSSAGMLFLLLLIGAAVRVTAEPPQDKPPFKPEELEQMLAPIALYPDALLSQILMASTYPLEVVEGDRWVKKNKNLTGTALTKALEAQTWDVSVKSLVNFPQVLSMMSDNLDVTVKIGDAFIGQQKQVMSTIQKLRSKAYESGNLKTTSQQNIVLDKQEGTQVIIIEPANPTVVYIPTYSPEVFYAVWPYPAYPPPPYYPPGYVPGRALAFTAGVAIGAAWGYAWGHSDWYHGNVNINVNRNLQVNNNINRAKYQNEYHGQGTFQHDASHRQGVAYRNQATAAQYHQQAAFSGRQNAFEGVDRGGSAARAESQRGSASRSGSFQFNSPSHFGGGGGAGRMGGHGGRR
ncbi:MAG: DUF3300 domain-containing protein [Chlorobiaceae bacterium]